MTDSDLNAKLQTLNKVFYPLFLFILLIFEYFFIPNIQIQNLKPQIKDFIMEKSIEREILF